METIEQISETEVKVTTEQVIHLSLIEQEIVTLQLEIEAVTFLEYPLKANDDMKKAFDDFNEKSLAIKNMLVAQHTEAVNKLAKYQI